MKSVYRTNGTNTDWITSYGWTNVTTGDALEFADNAAADTYIATLDIPPAGYTYGKSNPPGGPKRPKP